MQGNGMRTISIITPCRNSAGLLKSTLHSLHTQTAILSGRCRLEHLVMDGDSTDSTMEVLSGWPDLIVQSEPDTGMYDALAKGLRKCTGDIIGYLNAGDILFPWAFDVLIDVFDNPEMKWVTGYSSQINGRGHVTAAWAPPRYRREFILNGFYANPSYPNGIQQESTFWTRELGNRINLDRLSSFRLAGDYFIWSEMARTEELHSVMSQLGAFLIHPGQLSERSDDYTTEVLSCVRPPAKREKFTAWWETDCNPVLRGMLWNYTIGQSRAKIIDYNHALGRWVAK